MRLIILAAGQGYNLDGFNKLFLKDPRTGERNIERYLRLFQKYDITVVVGYKAVNVMCEYPKLDYILNYEWATRGAAYSLSLAIDETPCVIIPSDLFFDDGLIPVIDRAPANSIFVKHRENKSANPELVSIENNKVISIMDVDHGRNNPESVGLYKISSPKVLRQWKMNCRQNQNLFPGLILPLHIEEISAVDITAQPLYDINTPLDYYNLLKALKP